jgi:S1/P1 nuclease
MFPCNVIAPGVTTSQTQVNPKIVSGPSPWPVKRNFMFKLRHLIAVTLCLVILSSTSQAWFGFGHMAVAYVAYQKLTAEKKARVATLLKSNPYYKTKWKQMIPAGTPADQRDLMLFMIAATWPDEIKSDPAYKNDGTSGGNRPPSGPSASQNKGYSDHNRHKYWHFVDTPFTQDGTSPLPAIPKPNAETEIALLRAALASNKSNKLKSYDLVWLLHLVGDVHQPLHSSTRVSANEHDGDNGGNNVKLCANCKDELHAFWDGLPGDSAKPADVIPYARSLAPADPTLAAKNHESDWIQESFDIAQQTVYKDPIGLGDGPFTVTPAYKDTAQKIAAQRVALAGERLANLINDELK